MWQPGPEVSRLHVYPALQSASCSHGSCARGTQNVCVIFGPHELAVFVVHTLNVNCLQDAHAGQSLSAAQSS
jgi:hypothetical protein